MEIKGIVHVVAFLVFKSFWIKVQMNKCEGTCKCAEEFRPFSLTLLKKKKKLAQITKNN